MLFWHCRRAAASRTFCTAGSSRPMRMAMMAITTSSSISVNPRRGLTPENASTVAPRSWLDSLTADLSIELGHGPNLCRVVTASGGQPPAIGGERQAADEPGMAAKLPDKFSRARVPDAHGTVLTGRGDPPAVRAEGHGANVGVDFPAAPPEGGQQVTGLHVPDL